MEEKGSISFQEVQINSPSSSSSAPKREFSNPLAFANEVALDLGSGDGGGHGLGAASTSADEDGMVEVKFDQIEVSLDDDEEVDSTVGGGTGASSISSANGGGGGEFGKPVANATDFLAENNENYQVWNSPKRKAND